MSVPREVEAAAAYLARLKTDDRQAVLKQIEQLAVVTAPAENVERPELLVRTLDDYLLAELDDRPRLVEPAAVVREGLTVMYARAGFGKTSVNLHRILRWAAGLPMFDAFPEMYAPYGPLRTLLVENEGAGSEFQKKIGVMLAHAGFTKEQRALAGENVLVVKDGGYSDLRVDDSDSLRDLRLAIQKWQPDIVFLEPFSHLHLADENDNSQMRDVLATLQSLAKEFGVGVMIAHHERKGGAGDDDAMSAARGASVLEGAAAFMEQFLKVRGADQRELRITKRRYGAPEGFRPPDAVRMQWREDDSGWYDYVTPERELSEILTLLSPDSPSFVGRIAVELSDSDARVRRLLNRALDQGLVRRENGSAYGGGTSGYAWFLADEDQRGGMKF